MYQIQYLEGLEGFRALEKDWQALVEHLDRPHYNQCPEWYGAYLDAIPDAPKLTFCAVYKKSELVAILPHVFMGLRRFNFLLFKRQVRKAGLPYGEDIYSSDIVIAQSADPVEVWKAISKDMRKGAHAWEIFQVVSVLQSQNGFARLFNEHLSDSGLVFKKSPTYCNVINLKPYEELAADLKKKFRQQLQRSARTLNELGEFSASWHELAQVPDALEKFIELELEGWKGQPDSPKEGYATPSAIGLLDWKSRMYRQMFSRFSARGCARVLLLHLDHEVIGAQLSLPIGRTEYVLKTSMKEGFGTRVSIGHLMIEALIKRVEADNPTRHLKIDELNLLSNYDWPKPWLPERRPYFNYQIYNQSFLGRLLAIRRQLT
ncbi:MAG: GNAT family N-acetyltransferase [Pseudomonadota bacterium]